MDKETQTLHDLLDIGGKEGVYPSYIQATDFKLEVERRAYRDSKRLAYVSEAPVNWCSELGTVLANEEVIDGKSEVGGFPVIRKPMRQWMLRITAYAEKLLADLDTIDWSDSLKEMQRNWIGRSEGAEVKFQISNSKSQITVFHHSPRHFVRRDLHGAVAGTSAGEADNPNNIVLTKACEHAEQGSWK